MHLSIRLPSDHAATRRLAVLAVLVMAISLTFALACGTPVQAQSGGSLTIESVDLSNLPTVGLITTVITSDSKPAEGLDQSDFEASEGVAEAPVEGLRSSVLSDGPVSAVIAIDTSGSVSGEIDGAKQAADEFVRSLRSGDRAALVSFADSTRPLVDLTTDLQQVRQEIAGLESIGNTAFLDGLLTATTLSGSSAEAGKVVLVFSDGVEYGDISHADPDTIINEARSTGVQVYSIQVGERPSPPLPDSYTLFTELPALTGGRYFESLGPTTAQEIESHISERLRLRYLLSFEHDPSIEGNPPLTVTATALAATQGIRLCDFGGEAWVTSRPQIPEGTVIEGTPTIEPVVLCPPGEITRTEYFLDGEHQLTDDIAPFEYQLITEKIDRGPHDLGLRVTFEDGRSSEFAAEFELKGSTINWALILLFAGLAAIVVMAFVILNVRRRTTTTSASLPGQRFPGRPAAGTSDRTGGAGSIRIVSGPAAGQTHVLGAKETLIGRGPHCDITLSGDSVSREHATIVSDPDGYEIRDLKSMNGVRLNGKKVVQSRLKSGDRIEISPHVLEVAISDQNV